MHLEVAEAGAQRGFSTGNRRVIQRVAQRGPALEPASGLPDPIGRQVLDLSVEFVQPRILAAEGEARLGDGPDPGRDLESTAPTAATPRMAGESSQIVRWSRLSRPVEG